MPAGLALAGLPHLVGAPTPEAVPLQPPPAELARAFVVAALATAGLFRVVLGGVCGWAMRRLR
ncbi:MAG: hypothetical protein V3S29_01640 [bacterium]